MYRSLSLAMASAVAIMAAVNLSQAASPGVEVGSSGGTAAQAAAATPPSKELAVENLAPRDIETLMESTIPYPTPQLSAVPTEARSLIDPFAAATGPAPLVIEGKRGPVSTAKTDDGAASLPEISAQDVANPGITPFDYGSSSLGTVYHYTDRLLDTELNDDFPYRTVGWLRFVAADGQSYRCTAQLISRSIGVTAGHCVHDGGNKAAGWIRSGTFIPAYIGGSAPYGSAPVLLVATTTGWYNAGDLDAGYDVGIFTLGRRGGTTREIGTYTGYSSYCLSNCLQSTWYLTQLGYPANYYSGGYMMQGEHLEVSDSRDYVYGSGMQGGSSGGGHFANLGDLARYTSGSLGQWPYRNVIFATTSWGYVDSSIKIQGASSLSGPGNQNDFKGMYNTACTKARALHGAVSCSLLP